MARALIDPVSSWPLWPHDRLPVPAPTAPESSPTIPEAPEVEPEPNEEAAE
jgi:hypothetical protein